MLHLPPSVVPYLNALSHKETDHETEADSFAAALDQIGDWLAFESGYSLDDQESGQFENMALLLADVREGMAEPDKQKQLDRLVPRLYELVGAMEAVNARRQAPRYSAQPAVNDFLVCGAAFLQGRASVEAVENRLQRLEAYVSVLRQAFRLNKGRLKPEVAEALETGLEHLRAALAAAPEHLREQRLEAFQDSLATIAESAELLQHLIDWQRADSLRFDEGHARFAIPGVAAALEVTLEQGRALPRQQWARGIRNVQEQLLPQLHSAWQQMLLRLFVDPRVRASLLSEVEHGLESLEVAVEELLNPEISAEAAVDGFEAALENLSEAFLRLQEQTLSYQHLRGSQAGDYMEAILGALHHTMPFLAFPELFHSSPPPPEWQPVIDKILAFGDDLDPEHLYAAGYELLRLHPGAGEQAHPENWECVLCGHSNRVGTATCSACNSGAAVAVESGWAG
jgi:hypothetical protein